MQFQLSSLDEQSFVPTLPCLVAVDVDLRTGNPGRGGDTVTLLVIGAGGQALTSVSQFVQEGFDGLLHFDLPGSGIGVTPGSILRIRLQDTGKVVFHWRYRENTYSQGQAFIFGMPGSCNFILDCIG